MRARTSTALVFVATLFNARSALAQRPVTLHEAIDSALARGPRVAVARADSAAAAARITTARAFPNPLALLGYSEAVPLYHFEIEQEIEYPFLRSARIRAARAAAVASTFELRAERASIRYDVQVAYATTVATVAIRTISTASATYTQELLRITRERENVGDASQLDVRLATLAAGQSQNQAASDSLQTDLAILELQSLMGMLTDRVSIVPADTLEIAGQPAPAAPAAPALSQAPLRVAAAEQQLASERANLQTARRARIPALSIRAGVEWHDPDQHGALPTVGIAIPLPLWNRNKGPIAEARAATARANASLALARLQATSALTLAAREREVLRAKVERGRAIIEDARRVAEMTLTAYREGQYPLAAALEAQQEARNAARQFVEDVQASRIAEAAFIRAQVVGGAQP